jgi:hypothetical protein
LSNENVVQKFNKMGTKIVSMEEKNGIRLEKKSSCKFLCGLEPFSNFMKFKTNILE